MRYQTKGNSLEKWRISIWKLKLFLQLQSKFLKKWRGFTTRMVLIFDKSRRNKFYLKEFDAFIKSCNTFLGIMIVAYSDKFKNNCIGKRERIFLIFFGYLLYYKQKKNYKSYKSDNFSVDVFYSYLRLIFFRRNLIINYCHIIEPPLINI